MHEHGFDPDWDHVYISVILVLAVCMRSLA